MQLVKKKVTLRLSNLMPEQSEANNNTSQINVSPVLHTVSFLLVGQKMNLFAPQGGKKVQFLTR